MEKKINCALLGYGFSGATIHHPLLAALPEYSLKKIYSSKPGYSADLKSVIGDSDVDLVIITTPNDSHFKFAMESLANGKHVVLEKPSVLTTREFDELTNEARSRRKTVSVFQNRRWDSDFLTIQKMLSANTFGEVRYFESHFDRFRPVVQNRWRENDSPGGGLAYDVGPHLIDQALVLFGRPDRIRSDIARQRPGVVVEDYLNLVFTYGSLRVVLHADMLTAHSPFRFLVRGTRGTYLKSGFDSQESVLRKGGGPRSPGWGEEDESSSGLFYTETGKTAVKAEKGGYEQYYQMLARHLDGKGPAPVELHFARDTIEIIEKTLSVKEGGNEFIL